MAVKEINLAEKLPADWGTYGAAEKIDWFNTVGATTQDLIKAGVPEADINWMLQNGFIDGGYTELYNQELTKAGLADELTEQDKIDLYNELVAVNNDDETLRDYAEEIFGKQTDADWDYLKSRALQDYINEEYGGITSENAADIVQDAAARNVDNELFAEAIGAEIVKEGDNEFIQFTPGFVGPESIQPAAAPPAAPAIEYTDQQIADYIAQTYGTVNADNLQAVVDEAVREGVPIEQVARAIGAGLTPTEGGYSFSLPQTAAPAPTFTDQQVSDYIAQNFGAVNSGNFSDVINAAYGQGFSPEQIARVTGATLSPTEGGFSFSLPPPPAKTFTNEEVQNLITDQFGSVTPDNFQKVVDAVIGAGVPVDQFASVVGATISTNDAGQTSLTLPAAEKPKPAAPVNAQELETAKRGQPNETAAANLQQQLAAQTAAYKVTHNASFSGEQDKIIADMAKQLSRVGVQDLSDIVQGTRTRQEPIYDPNYYGDGTPPIIGYEDVPESVVVNKRTGEIIPMNELNNSAGSGFTWYNMQFVNGVPVFYASKEETGWNAFKQEQLPAILQFAKFIPGVTPFAIAAEAALKLDEGMELDEVFKDTVDSIAKAELSTFLQNVVGAQFPELGLPANAPSMFEARYYDQLGNLFSAEEITAIKDYADPQNQQGGFYGNTKTAEYDPKTGVTKFYDSTGVNQIGEMGADGIYRSLVTGNQAPIASPSSATDSTGQQTVTVTGTQAPTGGITSLPTGGTKTDATVLVTSKKTDEPITALPVTAKVGTTTTTKGDVTVVGERTTDDGYRDEGESGTATFLVSDPSGLNTTNRETVKNEVLVTGEKEKTGVTGTTGTTKTSVINTIQQIASGEKDITDLTSDEIEALLKAGFTASLLLGGGVESPTIPTTNVDIEGITTRRPGFDVDLTPTIPPGSTTTTTTTPGQTVYTNLGINTGKPTSPTTPTTGIGSLPVPTYKPPPFLGAQAPGASRITPPVLTADPTFTQADFTAAAKDIATQQAALPPIVQVAPSSPFEAGLAKGTTVAKRAGGIVALRGGGIPLFQMGGPVAFAYGGMTAPVNEPRMLSGGGDGMSDSIPATINGTQPARLADGEFVIPADVVSDIGNGSSKAGAKELYAMMDRVRQSRHGTTKQPPEVNMDKVLPV